MKQTEQLNNQCMTRLRNGDPCFCAPDRCQACWDGLTPSSLIYAQPPANWCWAIPFVHAQMESRFFAEVRVWRL